MGVAFMTNTDNKIDLGFAPGVKLHYKAHFGKGSGTTEPCVGLSVPITINMKYQDMCFPMPAITFEIRLGSSTSKKK